MVAADCLVKNFTAVVDPLSAILRDILLVRFSKSAFPRDIITYFPSRAIEVQVWHDLASIGSIRMPIQSTAFFCISTITLTIYRIISNLSNGEKLRLVAVYKSL